MALTENRTVPVYDSARTPPSFWEELVELWRYRDLVVQMVLRDVKVRYKRSWLGVAWTMLNPLLMMAVLTLVFSHLFRFELPYYPAYLLSGLILWNFFAQSSTQAMLHLLWGGSLLTRIYLPKTVFAVAAVGTGLVNLLLALIPLAVVQWAIGAPLHGSAWVWLPIPIVLTAMFTLGIGLVVSSFAVYFPDFVEMYQVGTLAWYFLTPVLYPKSIIPEAYRWWLNLNPMYHLVEVFRMPIYYGYPAGPHTLAAATVAAIGTLVLGWLVFTSRARTIAYRL
ncbi:MAG: ABC transporter permease [Acidobacteria bacterium]|nr:ABC transporter permease [Acidobacteriota bacterium]MDW7984628.1 ABC transporter permease [Acidobacteriota bacterium]